MRYTLSPSYTLSFLLLLPSPSLLHLTFLAFLDLLPPNSRILQFPRSDSPQFMNYVAIPPPFPLSIRYLWPRASSRHPTLNLLNHLVFPSRQHHTAPLLYFVPAPPSSPPTHTVKQKDRWQDSPSQPPPEETEALQNRLRDLTKATGPCTGTC